MTITPFPAPLARVDQRSLEFLRTLVALGGYCTAAQAKQLGVAGSDTRTRSQLRCWQRSGLLRKVAAYPLVYQVTKITTRLLGRDSSARRARALAAIQARLLGMNFYLEARAWPAEFIFGHELKVTTLRNAGCPLAVLPQRCNKPYLWEDFILLLANGRIGVAIVDQTQPSAFSQLRQLMWRFQMLLSYMKNELQLFIVSQNQHRAQVYDRLLHHPAWLKNSQIKPETEITPYWVRMPVPTVKELLYRNKTRNELPWLEFDEGSGSRICDSDSTHKGTRGDLMLDGRKSPNI